MGKNRRQSYLLIFLGSSFYLGYKMFNISLDKYCEIKKILKIRNYRLLGKYTHNMDLNFICTKEEIPNIGLNIRNDICNNEESVKTQMKQSNGSSPGNTRGHKKHMKNKLVRLKQKNILIWRKRYSRNLIIRIFLKTTEQLVKLYKKVIIKKYRLRFALPLVLFLLFSLGLILDFTCNCGLTRGLYKLLSFSLGKELMRNFHTYLQTAVGSFFKYSVPKTNGSGTTDFYITPFFDFLIYCVLFFILV
ncbi:fam-l protein [Plasmodium malariae]|uniref:Fam-l protein n=1 Tax=Plasmodium malariae TaxID=5858 RepID=A0A1D3JHN4_PLAMA|nr:fam-l protein [Plasmodium malariae]SBT85920.1 fam-l protein [Plasmodium malariae]